MHVVDGNVRDANMNYVCAAGTGSFVEEPAMRLGYRIAEAGSVVLGLGQVECPPFLRPRIMAGLLRTRRILHAQEPLHGGADCGHRARE